MDADTMVSVVSSDETLLSSFLQSPTSVSIEHAAACIERIVTVAGIPPGAPKTSVQLAQQTLQHLFKEPVPGILPYLLPVCEREVSLDAIDVFVLCTAAWKAITAAVLKYGHDKVVDSKIALRIIRCACHSALSVLLRAVTLLHSTANNPSDLSRCVKIAKFYCVNAERCTKAFTSLMIGREALSDEFINALGSVLRLVAFMSHVLMEQFSLEAVRKELQEEIIPLVSSAFQSVIVMARPFLLESNLSTISSVFSKSLHAFSESNAFQLNNIPVVNSVIMRIFAIIHIMRYAAAEPPSGNGGDSHHSDVSCLRNLFHPVLCRILFESLDSAYQHLITIREPTSGATLLEIVAQQAAQCMAVVDADGSVKGVTPGAIQNALLSEMSSKNPARATVASEGVSYIFQMLPKHAKRRWNLLHGVVQCGRIAYAFGSAHASSRWIPLVSRLAENCLGEDDHLFTTFQATRSDGFIMKNDNSSPTCDAFTLRVVAGICEYKLAQKTEQKSCSPQLSDGLGDADYMQVLRAFRFDAAALQSLVKGFAKQEETPGEMTDSLLSIIPYVFDAPSASGLSSTILGKQSLPAAAFCRALNNVQPSYVNNETLERIIQYAYAAIKKYGWVVCAVITAFIARSVETLTPGTTDKLVWERLMDLLRLTIGKALEISNVKDDPRPAATCGAAIYHAVQVLSLLDSINNEVPSVELRFPSEVLTAVEDAQSRLQQSDTQISLNCGASHLEKEHDEIRREMEICRRGPNKLRNELSGQKTPISKIVRTMRENSAQVLTSLIAHNYQEQETRSLMKFEIEALKHMLDCAMLWMTKQPN